MVEIKKLTLKNQYRIVWLRYIYGVDLSNHCMKCLLGHNDKRFRGYMTSLADTKLENARYYYLCGVDKDFIYNNNMHVAFIQKEGSSINIDNNLFSVYIENAERINIVPDYINWSLKDAKNKLFNTCRNWQFANMIYKKDQTIRFNSVPENTKGLF